MHSKIGVGHIAVFNRCSHCINVMPFNWLMRFSTLMIAIHSVEWIIKQTNKGVSWGTKHSHCDDIASRSLWFRSHQRQIRRRETNRGAAIGARGNIHIHHGCVVNHAHANNCADIAFLANWSQEPKTISEAITIGVTKSA